MMLPCWKFFSFLAATQVCKIKLSESDITTSWHDNSVVNTHTSIAAGQVRRSRRYNISVSIAGEDDFYPSFVYESIPRNGNGRMLDPVKAGKEYDFPDGDGITIEADEGINMAWMQFIYRKDVDVRIVTTDGSPLGPASNVVIRPVDLGFKASSPKANTVLIRVPFQKSGARFSVEFQHDLYTYRSNGTEYVKDGGVVVSEEPKNGLIIFASPPLPDELVPSKTSSDVQVIHPGKMTEGSFGSKPTIIFESGIHWMVKDGLLGKSHITLHPNTHYVYFEPGAYIKAALEYTTRRPTFHTIGYGVVSGENYAYMANTVKNYTAVKDDRYSLRMFWHQSVTDNQTWHCIGPTLNSPPFNTMDLLPVKSTPHEEDNKVSVYIRDYKQVGAYYFQTDGTQMYKGSVRDVFWHVNDDAIKLYHSGAHLHGLTIWKARNNAIVQMGWKPRNVANVSLSNLRIIHNRWLRPDAYVPSAILGASPFYGDPQEIDTKRTMQVKIDDVVCEGICAALMTLAPMQNFDLRISNVHFKKLHEDTELRLGRSVVGMDEGEDMDNFIPGQGNLTLGIHIKNWTIGNTRVDKKNGSEDGMGQFKINPMLDGQWSIE
ncbi:dextranase [Fusarium beomiforme]|uniref:Dextranase n=1 Tax=Fusarium beomiforme TaxID=44412 RepID=A0A9P5ALH4_9HYPO|nr:dextranase [Fusarium beomiforme]